MVDRALTDTGYYYADAVLLAKFACITGRGDFLREGLLLFTVRNGLLNSRDYPKTYAEKIIISREGQLTLMHCHVNKTEDIINRGGGKLVFELYSRKGETDLADTPVVLQRDGVRVTIPAGGFAWLRVKG